MTNREAVLYVDREMLVAVLVLRGASRATVYRCAADISDGVGNWAMSVDHEQIRVEGGEKDDAEFPSVIQRILDSAAVAHYRVVATQEYRR